MIQLTLILILAIGISHILIRNENQVPNKNKVPHQQTKIPILPNTINIPTNPNHPRNLNPKIPLTHKESPV
jgi:hypothetical protein